MALVSKQTQPTKVAGKLRRAVRSSRFAGILGGRHMACAYYFNFCRLCQNKCNSRYLALRCVEESVADNVFSRKERACYQLANELKELIEDRNPLASEANVYADLLNASLGEVNWQEIADSYLEEIVD
jgi:hypothetical protein